MDSFSEVITKDTRSKFLLLSLLRGQITLDPVLNLADAVRCLK